MVWVIFDDETGLWERRPNPPRSRPSDREISDEDAAILDNLHSQMIAHSVKIHNYPVPE